MEALPNDIIRLLFSKVRIRLNKAAFATTCKRIAAIWVALKPNIKVQKPSLRTHEKILVSYMSSDKLSIDYILQYNKCYNVVKTQNSQIVYNSIIVLLGKCCATDATDGIDRLFDTFPDVQIPIKYLPVIVFLLVHKRIEKSAIRCYLEVLVGDKALQYPARSNSCLINSSYRILKRYDWCEHFPEIFGKTPLRRVFDVMKDPNSVLVKLVGETNDVKWTIQRTGSIQYNDNWSLV